VPLSGFASVYVVNPPPFTATARFEDEDTVETPKFLAPPTILPCGVIAAHSVTALMLPKRVQFVYVPTCRPPAADAPKIYALESDVDVNTVNNVSFVTAAGCVDV
jgi:hypothetical protein